MKFLIFIDNYRKYIFGNLLSLCGYLLVVKSIYYEIEIHELLKHCSPETDSFCLYSASLGAACGLILIFILIKSCLVGTILEFLIRKFLSSKKCEKFRQTKFYTCIENIHIPKPIRILHIIVFYIGFLPLLSLITASFFGFDFMHVL